MKQKWLLVSDAARARIFSVDDTEKELLPIRQFVSPAARLHDRDFSTDRPGRDANAAGGRHATSGRVSPKEQDALRFARMVVDHLEQSRVAHRFERLVLVAYPHFLGLLRKAASPSLERTVTAQIDKDLSKSEPRELRQRLVEHL